jgi:hypothetical protein
VRCPAFPTHKPMGDYNPDKKSVFIERISQGYLEIPNHWIIGVMVQQDDLKLRIPASFWPFILKLWHELNHPRRGKPDWTAVLSNREFPGIRPNDVSIYATALASSNLFRVKKGKYPLNKSSVYLYNSRATWVDWEAFARALMRAKDEAPNPDDIGMKAWGTLIRKYVDLETADIRETTNGQPGPPIKQEPSERWHYGYWVENVREAKKSEQVSENSGELAATNSQKQGD